LFCRGPERTHTLFFSSFLSFFHFFFIFFSHSHCTNCVPLSLHRPLVNAHALCRPSMSSEANARSSAEARESRALEALAAANAERDACVIQARFCFSFFSSPL
jgi:hypothetical protein